MSQTQTAEKKTIDLDAIQDMADKAGMTASELLEWGLYQVVLPANGIDRTPAEAAKSLLEDSRKQVGKIPEQLIPSNPLADFAEEAGLSFSELSELALFTIFDLIENSVFPGKQPIDLLHDDRQNQGPLIPSFQHDRVKVHPMMAALFSGDLKAVHGETFGDHSSEHVAPEHWFIRDSLKSAFNMKDWDHTICELMTIEPAIRHCPTLQNEAAAIRTLIEAERVLGDFCEAVDNC